jgi:iron-sulfur cluster repair protein YtfE (RIC family)
MREEDCRFSTPPFSGRSVGRNPGAGSIFRDVETRQCCGSGKREKKEASESGSLAFHFLLIMLYCLAMSAEGKS